MNQPKSFETRMGDAAFEFAVEHIGARSLIGKIYKDDIQFIHLAGWAKCMELLRTELGLAPESDLIAEILKWKASHEDLSNMLTPKPFQRRDDE